MAMADGDGKNIICTLKYAKSRYSYILPDDTNFGFMRVPHRGAFFLVR